MDGYGEPVRELPLGGLGIARRRWRGGGAAFGLPQLAELAEALERVGAGVERQAIGLGVDEQAVDGGERLGGLPPALLTALLLPELPVVAAVVLPLTPALAGAEDELGRRTGRRSPQRPPGR